MNNFLLQEDYPRDIYHSYSDTGERLYRRRKSSVPQKQYLAKNSISYPGVQPRHSGHSVESLQLSSNRSPTPEIIYKRGSYPNVTEFPLKKDLNKRAPLPDITPGYTRDEEKNDKQCVSESDGSSETSSNYNLVEGGHDRQNKSSSKSKESENPVEREVSLFGLTSVKFAEKERENMKKLDEQQEENLNFRELDVSPVPTPKVIFFSHYKYGNCPTRGLHQGACESPIVFLCVVGVLGINIRKNSDIKGICVDGETEIKSGQFADDTTLFSIHDQTSLQAIIDTLIIFERNSGLKLNYDKSSVYQIGSLRNSNAKVYPTKELNWTNEKVNMLGTDIRNSDIVKANMDDLLGKIKSIVHTWRFRDLSLMGKIVMLNSLIGSLFVYKINLVPLIADSLIDKIEETINVFLWKGN